MDSYLLVHIAGNVLMIWSRIHGVIGNLVSGLCFNLFIPSKTFKTTKLCVGSTCPDNLHLKPMLDTYKRAVLYANPSRDNKATKPTM